jgi:hypothetical protein
MMLKVKSIVAGRIFVRQTPVALAIALLSGMAIAQPAANTTSADVLESKSLFETGGQAGIGPRPFSSFLERLSSPVEKIKVNVAADNISADGVTGTDVNVQLLDAKGQVLKGEQDITIEVNGGARILLPGRLTSESGADRGDVDRITPGVQAKVKDGNLSFKLIAPYQPDTVVLRVSVRGVVERVIVRYVPDLRDMIAVGLIEGRLRSDKFDPKAIVPVRENDGFDTELRGLTKEFSGGKSNLGVRAAMYLKGKVKGDYLLTMAYDSDKDTRPQLFETIDPNAFYPVYGDSSVRGFDAQSSGKLYVRLDKNKSFLLYGDYTTNDDNPARLLGQYNRSLPGLRGHYEEGKVIANAFVAQQSLRQIVDEFPARGVSGPYSVSNANGIKGSEKIDIVVRSRNQTSVILKTIALTRGTDYEFEPFDGKILFREPIRSLDDQNNPISIRITYEVDQGGDRYTVFGGDVRLKITDNITAGVSAAKDSNPVAPQTVVGANLLLKITKNTEVLAEVARSSNVVNTNEFNVNSNLNLANRNGKVDGSAARLEIRHSDEKLRGNAYVMRADNDFINSSSGVTGGQQDVGGALNYGVTERFTITADAKLSKDRVVGSESNAASLGGDLKLTDRLTIGAGVRHVEQNAVSQSLQVNANCVSNGSVVYTGTVGGYNTGFGINQVGNQQIDQSRGIVGVCANVAPVANAVVPTGSDRNSVFGRVGFKVTDKLLLEGELQRITGTDPGNTIKLGAKYAATDNLNFTGEVQREFGGDNGNDNLYRLGADWRVADKTRLYSRYEYAREYGAAYGLGSGPLTKLFALGIDTQYMQDGNLYNEYRLADSSSGQSVQNAIGLRNGWNVAEGLRLVTNVERLKSTAGDATSIGVGAEYTASELWKGSGRVEWREDTANTNWLLTAGIARKLDRNWTFVGREYFSLINPRNGAVDTRQNRLQLGFAYRPVDNNRFDALGLYERKSESSADKQNTTNIVSLRGNYHPSRPWFVSGRFATKQVNELLSGTGVNDSYRASLLGARVTYDVTNRWSVGGITTMLAGTGGSRQYAYGLEVGYTLMDNLLVTLGYNWRGFRDDDLTGSDYTNRGWVLGVRYKFDEDLFKRDDARVNRALSPTATPAIGTGAAPAKP